MARNYFFFRPARLPLTSAELSETTVFNLQDGPALRANLELVFPGLTWRKEKLGQAKIGRAHV